MIKQVSLLVVAAMALGACAQVSTSTTGNLAVEQTAMTPTTISAGASDEVGQLLSRQYENQLSIQEASAAPAH